MVTKKGEQIKKEVEKELDIKIKKDEEVSKEMLEEFKGNKGGNK